MKKLRTIIGCLWPRGSRAEPQHDYTQRMDRRAEQSASHPTLHDLRNQRLALAPTLIDRMPQFRAIRDHLGKLNGTLPGRPLLVVLQGVPDDLHEFFIRRIGRIYLYDQAPNLKFLGELDWSAGVNHVDGLISDLAEKLSVQASPEQDLWTKICSESHSVCFFHTLQSSDWSQRHKDRCLQWLDKFKAADQALSKGQILVAFLCIIDSSSAKSEAMQKIINDINKEVGQSPHILMTQPLGKITAKDMRLWINGELERWFADVELHLSTSLSSLTEELFQDNANGELMLGMLLKKIRPELDKAIRKTGVVSE